MMDKKAAAKLWIEQWHRAGPVLQKLRHDELRAMSDEDARQAFQTLAEFACEVTQPTPRTTSGFVEQQRLFQKLLTHGSAD
jgi:hypothetical protein